jgi:hypothetical protein
MNLRRFQHLPILSVVKIGLDDHTWKVADVYGKPVYRQLYMWETIDTVRDILSGAAMAVALKCHEDNNDSPTLIDVKNPFPFRCYALKHHNQSKKAVPEATTDTADTTDTTDTTATTFYTCMCSVQYPAKAAFAVLDYLAAHHTEPVNDDWFEQVSAQPDKLDHLRQVQAALEEVKESVADSLRKLTIRGAQIEDLLTQTEQLADTSRDFLKGAKRTRKCCWLF